MEENRIDEIDEKLDKTEDDEIIINLLYEKVNLLESIIGKKNKEIAKLKKSNEQMNNNFSNLMHIL